MSDTNPHVHSGDLPVEADGISYRGIVWFVVVLTVTTLFCQALVWGMFELMAWREAGRDISRAPLAGELITPRIESETGQINAGSARPGPDMLVGESTFLRRFRETEADELTTYGWMDQNAGTVRLPIERAKALMLERGYAVRDRE